MRLYQILDTQTRRVIPGVFFANKVEAKEKRQELNGGSEPKSFRYVVSLGPDHHRFNARSK